MRHQKRTNHEWDFASSDTKYYTHGIHPYPAMMIPQVAERIIAENGKNAEQGLDPFCGSGSVLLEFKLGGINCYGTDINPLAALISRVKNTPIDPKAIVTELKNLQRTISQQALTAELQFPTFFNIEYWFKPEVIPRLATIKHAIDEIKNKEIREFFLVCFSETARRSSNTRGSEFKLYRIPETKLANYNPDALKIFYEVVNRNLEGMQSFYTICQQKTTGNVRVLLTDITKESKVPPNSIDLVVTSPPYGDSRTTVAYGQFSRLSLQWLGFPEEIKQIDKQMLGGKPAPTLEFNFSSPELEDTINKIAEKDELRARDVLSFFIDFYDVAKEVNRVMKENSKICLVVGNRTVKGITIPTDEIMAEIFEDFNYSHKETLVRSIPSKRMPKRNSPTNVKGETLSTMNEESIVILKR
ncbi:hypothetical protein AUJ65_04640 [Candidatus Micrarchaeota archaeon CG1_02_51_15]|nr:MAG: hypothetical protein AUJ65_04640 [Candidatus Micrarchaeota archaeon CG1_02_51_15]